MTSNGIDVSDLSRHARHALFRINPERQWGEEGYLANAGFFARILAEGEEVTPSDVVATFTNRFGASAAVNGDVTLTNRIAAAMNALPH